MVYNLHFYPKCFPLGCLDPMFVVIITGIEAAMITLLEKQFSNNYDAEAERQGMLITSHHHTHNTIWFDKSITNSLKITYYYKILKSKKKYEKI